MKSFKTLRARFALWLTLLILVFLAAFGGFVYFTLSNSLYGAVDDALALSAEQVFSSLSNDNGKVFLPSFDPYAPNLSDFGAFTERGITLIILSQKGEVLQANGLDSLINLPAPRSQTHPEFHTISEENEVDRIRVYTLPLLEDGRSIGWIQTMQSLTNAEESLDRLRTALLVGSGFFSLLAGFAGYFLAGRALAPIDEITNTAHRISTEDLSARLNLPDSGDEVSRLANTFDEMLARIENGFTRERQFTADVSHELRTPLTTMQTILDIIREGERPTQEYRQALDDLAEETNRLHGLVEDLLQLVRGEKDSEFFREEIDLASLLKDVVDSLQPLAENKRLTLTCNLPPSLVIFGDTDQLIRLFVNLLDNGIKYTERGSVTLSAHEQVAYAVIEVADTGIGIPSEHLPHIFERFYRVESSRSSEGVGLGLSIAEQIIQAHDGRFEVKSEVDTGTTFSVYLPK